MGTAVPPAAAQAPAQAFLGTDAPKGAGADLGCASHQPPLWENPCGAAGECQARWAQGHCSPRCHRRSPRPLPSPTATFISMHSLKTLLFEAPMCFRSIFLGRAPCELHHLPLAAGRALLLLPVSVGIAWDSQNDVSRSLFTMVMVNKPQIAPHQRKLLIFWR